MISKYKIFTEERELSMINETVVYIVKDLLKILNKLSGDRNETISGMAKDILSLRGKDIDQDITMLNIDEKEPGFVTFTSFKNIKNNFKNSKIELDNYFTNTGIIDPSYIQAVWDESSEPYPNIRKSRTPTRIGRLLNSLFPKKYLAKDVELFTNAFKATQENLTEKISIVEGDDIKFWYNEDNYAISSGSLGNSCMKRRRTVFGIYTNNPEVCRMVIITEDNKLVGRALLWKVEGKEFDYFLDRQYTANDSLVAKFRKYADDNGFAYKTRNNHSSYKEVTYKGETSSMDLTVKVKPYRDSDYKYPEYPYMDTFRRYDCKTGILYNDDEQSGNIGQYLLGDTEGGYTEIEDTVYSEHYGDNISRQSAVWSDPLSTYLDRNDSIEVTAGSNRYRGWYPEDYDDIAHDCITNISYHTNDCTYSDYYSDYIYEEDAKKVVESISKDGSVDMTIISDKDTRIKLIPIIEIGEAYWIKYVRSKYDSDIDDYEIIKSYLSKDHKGIYVPDSLIIGTFEFNSEFGKVWLDPIDANTLGLPVTKNKDGDREEDLIEYYNRIYDNAKLYKDLLEGSKSKLAVGRNQLRFDFDDDYNTRVRVRERDSKIHMKFAIYRDMDYKI